MVSILTRIFGFSNLEIIEDAVQDTFLKATQDEKMTATMREFSDYFAEKLEIKKGS